MDLSALISAESPDSRRYFWEILIPMLCVAAMVTFQYLMMFAGQEGDLTVYTIYAYMGMGSFYAMILYIAVTMSYRGFQRQSRFRLSRKHPVTDYVLNLVIVLSPYLALLVDPLFLIAALALHIFSQLRSPDMMDGNIPKRDNVWLLHVFQMIVALIGIALYNKPFA